ncbi:hypothetical protein [Paenibacillus thalictri]|uniref:DUF3679 domain-containing protein n=1 Tax=Paenibacillus thalictri TaxID=2527873 RepID=A0A4Q9DGQ8_9BACL|nr:hypothetical protein [Paenibacillus thalictri]TBL70429.1 hypothetical protein EYB31_33475 [Paenibacillus thalictri]
MGKFYLKLFIISLIAAFCIFFGVDLAGKGVERVQGPASAGSAVKSAAAAQPPAKPEAKAAQPAKKPETSNSKPEQEVAQREQVTADSGINRVSNKAGDLLQIIAYHGIKFFVSLLDGIFG